MGRMTEQELLELIASQVGNLTKDMAEVKTELAEVKTDLTNIKATVAIKQELAEVKTIVVKIENDHGQKLDALFDGYTQNSEKLDRIEAEVTKHEEFILKRLK